MSERQIETIQKYLDKVDRERRVDINLLWAIFAQLRDLENRLSRLESNVYPPDTLGDCAHTTFFKQALNKDPLEAERNR